MKTSNYIAAALYNHGVKCVFEVSGGMITHLLDSINRQGKIRVVSATTNRLPHSQRTAWDG